jgi:hypothetical protein
MSRPLKKADDAAPQSRPSVPPGPPVTPPESCDICGSESVQWRSCKLICLSCRAIVRSCADL